MREEGNDVNKMVAEEAGRKYTRRRSSRNCACGLLILAVLIIALLVGLLLHFYLPRKESESENILVEAPLVDCQPHKESIPSVDREENCRQSGCAWQPDNGGNLTKCVYTNSHGYRISEAVNVTEKGLRIKLTASQQPTVFGMIPFQNLFVDVEYQTDNRLRIKIYPDVERFEIPKEALDIPAAAHAPSSSTRLYDVTYSTEPIFGVMVRRRATNVTIFDTGMPGFIFADQFLQISTRLNNSYVYGFGEHRHETFRHDMNWRTWSIFTRDNSPDNDWNIYGAHPVYMNVEDDGKANMVFLKNSNAMEVTLQPDPTPAITYRTIGGILDFYVFLGSSPGDAVSQYTEAIGRPVLPPYWALGYQLSRWGYLDIQDMRMVINRTRAAQIPYDVQWADIDCLFNKYVFTYDRTNWTGLPELVDDLHNHHQHFVIIVDPGVGANLTINTMARTNSPGYAMFEDGEAADIFVQDASGKTLIGEVWPGITAYPDFTNVSVLPWFEKYVRFLRETEGVKVDALWIDMNEPSSFVAGSTQGCEKTNWDYPPYVPKILGAGPEGKMFDKTICMTAQHAWGKHYNVHGLYAHAMAMRTNSVLRNIFPGKRPWAMTRSSFAGTGHYATKWTGDNRSLWPAMHWSIIGIMEFGLFGFALNGADICGFWYEATFELCVRWHQLGAFYPFARNHNGKGDPPVIFKHQDPASFGQRFVDIIKRPLMVRYKLLPYLYTLMHRASVQGDTVMRPLMFEFPVDMTARDIDRQFLLGPALLVSPVLSEGAQEVNAYFPSARWYDYFTGRPVSAAGKWLTLHTPLENFNLHVRGGHVIPWQTPALTTYESRQNSMGLMVALDSSFLAQGELFLDDGETDVLNETYGYATIYFKMEKAGELMIQPNETNYILPANLVFDTVEIFGLGSAVSDLTVDGQPLPLSHVTFIDAKVQFSNLSLPVKTAHTIKWTASL